ncbi:hypothetical protein Glove_319g171 [Diversispora epigaea]|uniref:Uncharacterized protein n=1 Tax=Diversispora epigaea TaxID=1348612 RepID=A0A397HU42_9GLOM|nr:hypothetical protein Glove_319g171 [Diversispora epigaea]
MPLSGEDSLSLSVMTNNSFRLLYCNSFRFLPKNLFDDGDDDIFLLSPIISLLHFLYHYHHHHHVHLISYQHQRQFLLNKKWLNFQTKLWCFINGHKSKT